METLGVHPSCAPARRQRTSPCSAERNSPLRFSEKLSARQGRTRLRQFVHPGFLVQKKSRPLGANPLTQFVSPGQLEPGREPPRQGVAHTRLVRPAKFLCNREKEKALTFVSAEWWKLQGSNL